MYGSLFRTAVLELHDAQYIAVFIADHTAVCAGIRQRNGQHRHIRPLNGVIQCRQGFRLDCGGVAVDNEGCAGLPAQLFRLHYRMSGSELRFLHGKLTHAVQRSLHLFPAIADHGDDTFRTAFSEIFNNYFCHRHISDLVEYLRQVAVHAGSFSRRKDNRISHKLKSSAPYYIEKAVFRETAQNS